MKELLMTSVIVLLASVINAEPIQDENADTEFWFKNALFYHKFTIEETANATGLSIDEVNHLAAYFSINDIQVFTHKLREPLLILPYPGGRHPRIGFRDGAINPQRGTKISIFLPWQSAGYIVLDLPEAIWTDLGLTFLAHTHIPTIWDKKEVSLPCLEWKYKDNGRLMNELTMPNGITFKGKVIPQIDGVKLELSLKNGTKKTLSYIQAQICLMFKGAPEFSRQTNKNKLRIGRFVVCRSKNEKKRIAMTWEKGKLWFNPQVPCMHSDPIFPEVESGKTVKTRGYIFIYTGTDIQTEITRWESIAVQR